MNKICRSWLASSAVVLAATLVEAPSFMPPAAAHTLPAHSGSTSVQHVGSTAVRLVGSTAVRHPGGTSVQRSETAPQANEPLLSKVRQLTFAGRRSGEGYFSADGKKLIFQSERVEGNPFYQIFSLDLVTGEETRVTPGVGKATCSWFHPQGKGVLYASTHDDPKAQDKQHAELAERASNTKRRYSWDFDENYELYAAGLDGSHPVNLTHTRGYDAEASYSPDGEWIAFASNRQAYEPGFSASDRDLFERDPSSAMEIYRMRADGSQVQRLTHHAGYDGGPFYSADGRFICWRRFSLDGATAEIWSMNADGANPRQLTHLGCMSWAPYFHPSGDYLVFATNKHGYDNFELYLVDAGGRHEPVRLTSSEGFDGLPVFSPDGQQLAWTSGRTPDHKAQIFLANFDDALARRLLDLPPRAGQGSQAPLGPSQASTHSSVDRLRKDVAWLCSDATAGRLTGTPGEALAANYVQTRFRELGLQPAGDAGGYLQAFGFTAGVSLGGNNHFYLHNGDQRTEARLDQDWRPLAFSKTGSWEPAEVVFAGYGIVAPAASASTLGQQGASQSPANPHAAAAGVAAYDSYAGLDVKGRWVLVFRNLPGSADGPTREHLGRFAGLRYKAMLARERGARGLLVVNGPLAQARNELVKLASDVSLSDAGIPVVSISNSAAQCLLAGSGHDLAALQTAAEGLKAPSGMMLPKVRVEAQVDIVQEKRLGHNVLGRLNVPGATSTIVIGAHLDHLGHGLDGTSLARGEQRGKIHGGADDNASGVAGLLELARQTTEAVRAGRVHLRTNLVFAAWSGEELGLLGSSWYVDHMLPHQSPHGSLGTTVRAAFNLDMIGRYGQQLILQGGGSSTAWGGLLEQATASSQLAVSLQDESYLPTDATSFYLHGVPILSAFTGAHSDYHTPSDTPDKLDYARMADITGLLERLVLRVGSQEQGLSYRKMERPAQVSHASARAWVGSIPDYAQGDIKGVRLSGVVAKGPAEMAGLQAGDIIVEVGGRTIVNIYDYTYALEALQVGKPVRMVVQRQASRIEVTVTPASRE